MVAGISELRMREEATELAGTALVTGSRRLAREHFKHQPPSALEIEAAIAAIEDEIARSKPPRGLRPVTHHAAVRERRLLRDYRAAAAKRGRWRKASTLQAPAPANTK